MNKPIFVNENSFNLKIRTDNSHVSHYVCLLSFNDEIVPSTCDIAMLSSRYHSVTVSTSSVFYGATFLFYYVDCLKIPVCVILFYQNAYACQESCNSVSQGFFFLRRGKYFFLAR